MPSPLIKILRFGVIALLLLNIGILIWRHLPKRPVYVEEQYQLSDDPARNYVLFRPDPLPRGEKCWLLVAVHGLGGEAAATGRRYAPIFLNGIFPCIILAPQLRDGYQCPQFGEGLVMEKMITEVGQRYQVQPRVLLDGFSGGAQCVHRFALQHPEQVYACAAHSAGRWTTPDGHELGPDQKNPPATSASASQATLNIPFFITCGLQDSSRINLAREFAASLHAQGYTCRESWPDNSHDLSSATLEESRDFFREAINH